MPKKSAIQIQPIGEKIVSAPMLNGVAPLIPKMMIEGSDNERLHALMLLLHRDQEMNPGVMPLAHQEMDKSLRPDIVMGNIPRSPAEKRLLADALSSDNPLARNLGATLLANTQPKDYKKTDLPRIMHGLLDPSISVRESIHSVLSSYSLNDPVSLVRVIDSFRANNSRMIDSDATARMMLLKKEAEARKAKVHKK
jgi:hypothetical protein